jgi:hypothetical protein
MMARSRNIKPGLFTNELIAELPAFDRLLFIGLWCLADREGRLEDRPKRIKMELFPCDDYAVDGGLSHLAGAGFISRYQINGSPIIEIDNFQKHQSPHGTEKDSILPGKDGRLTINERKANGVVTGKKRSVHVPSEGINGESTLSNVNPPSNNALIPDSLIPIEHNTLGVGDEISVDPKCPTEMTLEWQPDENLLATYSKRMGLPVALFTHEAIGAFVCHYSATGRCETQAAWVSLLVKWIKRDMATGAAASNVRPFPRRQANGPDFDDTTWAEDLGGVL